MTILITAFDPFGGDKANISQQLPEEPDGALRVLIQSRPPA